MKGVHLGVLCCCVTLLAFGSAQYYGTYGRNVLIRPQLAPYPYSPNPFQVQSAVAPSLLSRVGADMPQNARVISQGAERFSFDMYRVSCIPIWLHNFGIWRKKVKKWKFLFNIKFIWLLLIHSINDSKHWKSKLKINLKYEFQAIAHAVQNYDANFVISPFSVWCLMLLVSEGADGQTYGLFLFPFKITPHIISHRDLQK